MTETIEERVAKGDKIQIPGFISFQKVKRAARTGRNPQTGATHPDPGERHGQGDRGRAPEERRQVAPPRSRTSRAARPRAPRCARLRAPSCAPGSGRRLVSVPWNPPMRPRDPAPVGTRHADRRCADGRRQRMDALRPRPRLPGRRHDRRRTRGRPRRPSRGRTRSADCSSSSTCGSGASVSRPRGSRSTPPLPTPSPASFSASSWRATTSSSSCVSASTAPTSPTAGIMVTEAEFAGC